MGGDYFIYGGFSTEKARLLENWRRKSEHANLCAGGEPMRIKRSTLAGTWYPAHPEELRAMVDDFLAGAEIPPVGRVFAVISPHAGYVYSGSVAAYAYRALRRNSWRRAVILAPSHRAVFRGAVTIEADAFETPLGLVPIDCAAQRALVEDGSVAWGSAAFAGEHSLEIQLPFWRHIAPDAPVVPLLLGDLDLVGHRELAAAIDPLIDGTTAVVVSSDFTHYGWRFGYEPFPARDAEFVRSRLRDLDMGTIDTILRGDREDFLAYLARTGTTVCGRVPITTFLTWLQGRVPGVLLDYRTSLDVTGDPEHVVSYAAIAFAAPGECAA